MPINFPSAPSVDQTYTSGTVTWKYTGTAWRIEAMDPGYATETYVDNTVADLVDGAPGVLNTLNELAAAINDDSTFAGTVFAALDNKEPTITAGTTGQYWRGDKSWQTLNASAVGLGNVTNESKATMFNNPALTGTATSAGNITFGDGYGVLVGSTEYGRLWWNASYAQFIHSSGTTGCLFNNGLFVIKAGSTDAVTVTSGTTTVANALEVTGLGRFSYQSISPAGSTQGDAAAITKNLVMILNSAPSGGIRLPASQPYGTRILVRNSAASARSVYPPSGEEVQGAGAVNSAYSHASLSWREYIKTENPLGSGADWWWVLSPT